MKEIALSPELYEYIVTRFARPERDLLKRMLARADAAGMPRIQVSEEQARFLRLFVGGIGARRALDVGTLFGYSAAHLALGMGPRGRVLSLELETSYADVARANLADAGLASQVEIQVGPALDSMRALPSRGFDVILVDADKANYGRYLEEGLRLVRPGGWLLFDNVFAFGKILGDSEEPQVQTIRAFNDALAKRSDVDATLVPVGDGMAIVRTRAEPVRDRTPTTRARRARPRSARAR